MVRARRDGGVAGRTPSISINVDVDDVFGVNAHSVLGQIVGELRKMPFLSVLLFPSALNVPAWATFDDINRSVDSARGTTFDVSNYLDNGHLQLGSDSYRKFLGDFTSLVWFIQPYFMIDGEKTLFYQESGRFILKVAFTTTLKEHEPPETVYEDIDKEIKIIRSFKDHPKIIKVGKGESLWEISKKVYPSPFDYYVLAFTNGISGSKIGKIRVGTQLTILPLYQLSGFSGAIVVVPGDTLEGLCLQFQKAAVSACVKRMKMKNDGITNDKIYPLEILRYQ